MSLYSWRVQQGRFIGFEHYQALLGNWAGALLFLAGLAAILLAHWLWVDGFRRMSARAGFKKARELFRMTYFLMSRQLSPLP
jgi:cyanate permease